MAYTKTIWENSPSENTPLSAENLNNIENGIDDVDTRLTTAESDINNVDTRLTTAESDINNVDTRLTTAEGEIDTAQTDINNAESVIGNETDTYSASSTYALGSLVIYNSLLYKCTTAITVAEAWTIAHWTQVSLTSLAQSREILYNNANGSNGTITLSNNPLNYDYIELIFGIKGANGWTYGLSSTKINTSITTNVNITQNIAGAGWGSSYYEKWHLTSTQLVRDGGWFYNSDTAGNAYNSIYIAEVIGYKEV